MNSQVKELVDHLKISFDRKDGTHYHPYYFYYTTLSTLAAMLVNRRIKMSDVRSERINDLREPREFGDKLKWKQTRICCFASGWMENNAMWGCYGHPKDEAIMLRIPAGLMKELSGCPISYRDKASRVKLGWDLRGHDEKIKKLYRPMTSERRSMHDIAYFNGLSKDADDENDVLQIGFYRANQKIEDSIKLNQKRLSVIDPLVGYVKRIEWQYEDESRIHIEVLPKDVNQEVYLSLPQDFFKRVSVVLGPNFNLENESIQTFPQVSARDVLEEFLHQSEGGRKGRRRIIESAFYGLLNYSGSRVRSHVKHLKWMYGGVQVIEQSARQETLWNRFQELSGL